MANVEIKKSVTSVLEIRYSLFDIQNLMINMKKYCTVWLLFISTWALAQKEESDNRFVANKNKPARQEWLRDQGFGMFIHFNVDAQLGITISHSLVGASDDYVKRYYNELPKTFD